LPPTDSHPTGTVPDIQQAIGLALQHHTAGRLPEAESIYQQILHTDPNQPVALHLLGVIAHQVGKNDIAVDFITKALDVKPDYAEAHVNLGNSLKELGRLEDSAASYNKALEITPGIAAAHYNLGVVYKELGRLDESVASYRRTIAIAPDYAEAHNNLGNALHDLGQSEDAVIGYRDALAARSDYAEAHCNLGNVLRHLGKADEAAASCQEALANQPEYAEAHSNLGIAFQDLGKLEEAAVSLRKAISINPGSAVAQFNLHSLLIDPDDMAPSINCLKRAVEINPGNAYYRFMLGVLMDFCGDPEAASHLDIVESGNDTDRARLDAWGYIQSANEKLPPMIGSSIEAFELGIDAAPKDGLVLEFGVRFGTTIRQVAELANQDVHGFDSFEGLPEAWHHEPKGSYSTHGVVPSVAENVILHDGWFEDTLPGFVEKYPDPVRFINMDCDLYSSTKTVLDSLARQIVPGTVLVFDEYIGHEKWREHEFKAFQEAVATYGWKYEYLCFSFMTKQAAVRII